jgi:hypothetical protein
MCHNGRISGLCPSSGLPNNKKVLLIVYTIVRTLYVLLDMKMVHCLLRSRAFHVFGTISKQNRVHSFHGGFFQSTSSTFTLFSYLLQHQRGGRTFLLLL